MNTRSENFDEALYHISPNQVFWSESEGTLRAMSNEPNLAGDKKKFPADQKTGTMALEEELIVITDLHLPPSPISATDLHPKDINAPIYGINRARMAFEGIAILKNSCMRSSFSKFSKFAMFFVCTVKQSVQCWPIM